MAGQPNSQFPKLLARASGVSIAISLDLAFPSGIAAGATENAAAVKALLTRLRDQGLPTDRKYLFMAKALRAAIRK